MQQKGGHIAQIEGIFNEAIICSRREVILPK